VRDGSVSVLAGEARGDAVVEGERVPGEPSVRLERRGDALEGAPAVGPGRQMEERAERAVDKRGRLVEREVAHVGLAQIELDTRFGGTIARLREHRGRQIDADDRATGRQRDRDRHPAVADRELDERSVRLPREPGIEGDVFRHVRGPLVVAVRERFVPAHRPMLRPALIMRQRWLTGRRWDPSRKLAVFGRVERG
jgi:hypothetical protein